MIEFRRRILLTGIFLIIVLGCFNTECKNIGINRLNVKVNHYESIQSIKSFKTSLHHDRLYSHITNIKGGKVVSAKKKKQGPLQKIKESLGQIYPATRMYLLLCLFCTIVQLVGLPAPELLCMDKSKFYEIWRIFTSKAYLGAPSMSMATTLYFLIRHGQTLESEFGTGAFAWFLLIQILLLSILGLVLNFPFQAHSMITAAIYASSQLNPMERIPYQFGFIITSWQLPYCSMLVDILSQQSMAAAWPHILGIFSGHFYHFFTKLWPGLGGKDWLSPPKFILKMLGQKNSNVSGVDFSQKDNSSSTGDRNKNSGSNSKDKKRSILKNVKGRKLSEKTLSS